MLVLRDYHEQVHHQGRQITHGALRNAGYWLVGGNGAVASLISSCVTCRRLRGSMLEQKMADLPPDRAEIGPPFTNVGFDVFGPWTVHKADEEKQQIANAGVWFSHVWPAGRFTSNSSRPWRLVHSYVP